MTPRAVPLRRARNDRRQHRTDHHQSSSNPSYCPHLFRGTQSRRALVAGSGDYAIQHDGHDHQRQTTVERLPDVQDFQRPENRLAEAGSCHEGCDRDHRQSRHDRLIHANDARTS